ncbi:RagB/SusD family nutrient uptake outer membrane protein [Williamwhitmania taraxaci]|uniref:SusD family protein n=1 Tax=Williamwhitmania taraxaci TaxID=1640674 RepID=A0A1G6S6Z2_9BACT|nr:RagB/SusD family nutrient uptake outer membrane protein [Williamwhitmania taraxaci]SDD12464.1 SusD family protein [Williamwhitmania taraxaci]
MRKIKYILGIAAILSLGACSKDFLETAPTESIPAEDAFNTTSDAYAALNGIHRAMFFQYDAQDQAGQGSIMIDADLLGEDLVMTTLGNSWFVSTYRWIDHRNASSSGLPRFAWKFYYKIISNANTIINKIDNCVGPDKDKNQIKGQAFAFRAWAYFNLVQLYGKRYDVTTVPNTQLGVPLLLTNTIMGQPRATVEENYAQINADLDSSFVRLSNTYARDAKSHINLKVAQGLKARVALTMGDYTNAATYAALARTGYTPMNTTQYRDGFSSITNPEWMWGSAQISDQTTYFYSFFAYMSLNFSSTNIRSNPKAINNLVYNKIPATDIRKQLWWDGTPASWTSGAWTLPTTSFAKYAYMNRKFVVATYTSSVGDVVYMRAAEMYLIEAEALARSGQDGPAQNALFTLVSTRDNAYVKSTSTGATLIDEITTQRRIELWGEGFRFFDLKRTNSAMDRTGTNAVPSVSLIVTVPAGDPQWQFKIPKDELNANPAIQSQND